MAKGEPNTELQSAYAERKVKAGILMDAGRAFVQAWIEHEEAKQKEELLFAEENARLQRDRK